MTYEEYDEAVMSLLSDPFADDSELDELEKHYPEHAARMKQEADARRGCTYEEYQAQVEAANPPEEKAMFIGETEQYKAGDLIQDGKHQYRVTADSFWISVQEAREYNEAFDADDEAGWHTKARLIHG